MTTKAQSGRIAGPTGSAADVVVPVTIENFVRAETDMYFARLVRDAGVGRLTHQRSMAAIDKQDIVRMNRDTIYSSGVFDLDAAPITITLPDAGSRFMSMEIVSQDHFAIDVRYAPARSTYTKEQVGTRYVAVLIRTLANPEDLIDLKAANVCQDAIRIEQASPGRFEAPHWDRDSQGRIRSALEALATSIGSQGLGPMFGTKGQVDPISHLIGTAVGWGGNPRSSAIYEGVVPEHNDGKTIYTLTVKDVPVDGFWSVSVYNEKGFFEKNEQDAYSINTLTARPNADGSVTIQFGGCENGSLNCLPIVPGWNYTVRMYRPKPALLNGSWRFPDAKPRA